jgi:hypothetical protein
MLLIVGLDSRLDLEPPASIGRRVGWQRGTQVEM